MVTKEVSLLDLFTLSDFSHPFSLPALDEPMNFVIFGSQSALDLCSSSSPQSF